MNQFQNHLAQLLSSMSSRAIWYIVQSGWRSRSHLMLKWYWACLGHNFNIYAFMHGFQNIRAQFFLGSRGAIWNICSCRLKIKVTLEGQMIKWSFIELVLCLCLYSKVFKVPDYYLPHIWNGPSRFVQALTSTFMHGFQHSCSFKTFIQVGWRSKSHSWGVEVPFETFVLVGWRSRSHLKVKW